MRASAADNAGRLARCPRSRWRNIAPVILAVLLSAGSGPACAIFRADVTDVVPDDLRDHRFGNVRYEMINWRLDGARAAEMLLATLSTGAHFRELREGVGGSDWYVQIVLEPYPGNRELGSHIGEHPDRFVLGVLNNYVAGQTFLIFPIIRYLERRVSFVVWRRGRIVKEYNYHSDAWVVFGWAGLLLIGPSEKSYLRLDMARVARLFLTDAARDGVLTND